MRSSRPPSRSQRRVVDALAQRLAEFASVVDAVECASPSRPSSSLGMPPAPSRRCGFVSESISATSSSTAIAYGDGVNIAARLQSLADGGGILLSGTAYDQVEASSAAAEFKGEQTVKNIARAVRVYRVRLTPGASSVGSPTRRGRRRGLVKRVAGAVALAAALTIGAGSARASWERRIRRTAVRPSPPSRCCLREPQPGATQEYFSDGVTRI